MSQSKTQHYNAIPFHEVLDDHLDKEQWRDDHTQRFSVADRATTKLICSGLPETMLQLIKAMMAPIGIDMEPLPTPANSALQYGKEYGNRGQCNPTYFTVGALIEKLVYLRDKKGMSTESIIEKYAFLTAGGCGPCRMGMYATEYRKALRDSGFSGFRVLLISRFGDITSEQTSGLKFKAGELLKLLSTLIVGDIFNVLEKKIKPYEVEKGSTDKAMHAAKAMIADAYANNKSLLLAAWRCRKIINKIEVNYLQFKPKVLVQGEFWAKTTEGDGNYSLFQFLEDEGAEVMIESVSDWLLHQVWRARWELQRRQDMSFHDKGDKGLLGKSLYRKKLSYWFVDKTIRTVFRTFSVLMGLKESPLSNHDALAVTASPYFNLHVSGGEDHMEIAHHIHAVKHNRANMVLSVKPFTCLSSSGVSDGIQPMISEHYPASIFLAVETNGDAPANFYSRIQMQLFKAKQTAENEWQQAMQEVGFTKEQLEEKLKGTRKQRQALSHYDGPFACRAANALAGLSNSRLKSLKTFFRKALTGFSSITPTP